MRPTWFEVTTVPGEPLTVVADDLGNTGAGGPRTDMKLVTIHVLSPAQQIARLRNTIDAMFLQRAMNHGAMNSLVKKLEGALAALEDGRDRVAYNMIAALGNEVRAKFGEGSLLDSINDLLQGK